MALLRASGEIERQGIYLPFEANYSFFGRENIVLSSPVFAEQGYRFRHVLIRGRLINPQ